MDKEILFNCCTNCEAPDWTQFASLELGGCREDPDEEGHINGGYDRYEAEFFTVYSRCHKGYAEAITDWHGSFDEVVSTTEELARLSGLPLEIVC